MTKSIPRGRLGKISFSIVFHPSLAGGADIGTIEQLLELVNMFLTRAIRKVTV